MEIKAGNNTLVLDFDGNTTEENVAFLEVAQHVIGKKLVNEKGAVAQTTPQPVVKAVAPVVETPVVKEPVRAVEVKSEVKPVVSAPVQAAHKEDNIGKMMREAYNKPVAQEKAVFKTTRDFLESQPAQLIVGVCECEKDFHFWVDKGQEELEFKCKRCGEEKTLKIEDLIPATYRCDDCGKRTSFWTEANLSMAIDCVKCGTEIDLFYHDKKKILTNEN